MEIINLNAIFDAINYNLNKDFDELLKTDITVKTDGKCKVFQVKTKDRTISLVLQKGIPIEDSSLFIQDGISVKETTIKQMLMVSMYNT